MNESVAVVWYSMMIIVVTFIGSVILAYGTKVVSEYSALWARMEVWNESGRGELVKEKGGTIAEKGLEGRNHFWVIVLDIFIAIVVSAIVLLWLLSRVGEAGWEKEIGYGWAVLDVALLIVLFSYAYIADVSHEIMKVRERLRIEVEVGG